MNTPTPPQNFHPMEFRGILNDAIAYWERRRIIYNVLLTIVVLAWVVLTWPHFRPAFRWDAFVALLVLAVLANLCYCAAYIADLPMQYSSFRVGWRRWRWTLWLFGTLFAILFANHWIADEIYDFVAGNVH
ncbi:MAG TPA: hypothetical protein VJN21_03010 [Candidatus Acidoferrales bacterium]|nr:hypothetical protein [Candidatus Acidoferrales bacterium]